MNISLVLLMVALILVAALLFGLLLWFIAGSIRTGEAKIQKAVERAKKLAAKGSLNRAKSLLFATLRGNGYDYGAFVQAKKLNSVVTIQSISPRFNKLARKLRLTTFTVDFVWCWPAFLELGRIFIAENQYRDVVRLYVDLLDFLDGLASSLEREFVIEGRMICHEGLGEAYAALGEFEQAVANYGASWVEHIHLLKVRAFDITIKEITPLTRHEKIGRILASVGRSDRERDVYRILNASARPDTSAFDPVKAQRQIEALLRGIQSGLDKDREVATMLLRGIMDKVRAEGVEEDAEGPKDSDKKDEPNGDKGPDSDDIIYL